jgi:mono/diheme cytochrome c family protein
MKKFSHFRVILWQVGIIIILTNFLYASGQTVEKNQFSIPENVNKIFQTSCMSCHSNDGGRFPKSKLNFSRWGGYGAAKEAEKASLICLSVRKGSMPPKSTRVSKPELILTKEQIDLICKWAESIKAEEERK